ncbi:MAG: hypothetical protein ACI4JT_08720 [Oscillospiraceae bacterium]
MRRLNETAVGAVRWLGRAENLSSVLGNVAWQFRAIAAKRLLERSGGLGAQKTFPWCSADWLGNFGRLRRSGCWRGAGA